MNKFYVITTHKYSRLVVRGPFATFKEAQTYCDTCLITLKPFVVTGFSPK